MKQIKKINKCFFFDRDGVINYDFGHITSIKDIKFLSGVSQAIHYLNKKNYLVIIITNQSVVGRGYITDQDLKKIHIFIKKKLKEKKAIIDDIFYCAFHPKHGIGKYKRKSKDRKPGNGMLEKAIKKWKINRNQSFMIGDKKTDYLCAKKSKIKFFYKSKKKNLYNQLRSIKLL